MVRIVVLNDDRKSSEEFENEHGLSLYIEVDGYKMLFDAGQSDIFKKNAEKLGIKLDEINTVVLSHGHYDHGNGLKYIETKPRLICHPECNCYRISKSRGSFGGINQSCEELAQRFDMISTKDSYQISENIYYLGQIERKLDFEAKKFPMTKEDGTDDEVFDDTGIALKTPNGIIVISGCSHSGICNTIEYAKKITRESNVLAVMGGLHLKEIDEGTLKTIQYMQENNIQNVCLAHCTSDKVCQEIAKRMSYKVKIMQVGKEYTFDRKIDEREI